MILKTCFFFFTSGAKMIWEGCPWLWLHVEKFVIAYSKIQNMPVTPTEMFFPTYITMK